MMYKWIKILIGKLNGNKYFFLLFIKGEVKRVIKKNLTHPC